MPCGGIAAIAASDPTLEAKLVPDWVKNNAGWWATNQIGDADFINGVEYLINKQIIGIDNKKIKGKVPIEDVIFSPVWGVDKDKLVFVSSSFFEVYGTHGNCGFDPDSEINKWRSTTLGLNPNKADLYNEVALWNDPQNAVVVISLLYFYCISTTGFL